MMKGKNYQAGNSAVQKIKKNKTLLMNIIYEVLKKWLVSIKEDELPPVYLVGGAVRDYLLGRSINDIDLICRNAKQTALKLASHRNAAVISFEKKADEPCYRVVDRGDKNNFLDISPVRGSSIADDLARRDFTINAMAMRIDSTGKPGAVIDPLNGRDDLEKNLIRLTRVEAINSDPLRILRAIRFAAVFGFTIEENTLAVMKNNVALLADVAAERIMAELFKILNTDNSSKFIRLMDSLGILEIIIPEIKPMKGCRQNEYHHLDVWEHSLAALENVEKIIVRLKDNFAQTTKQVAGNLEKGNRLPLMKVGALLHDIGKPCARQIVPGSGKIIFHGHDQTGSKIIAEITRRLKMSKQDREYLQILVGEHMHILNFCHSDVRSNVRSKTCLKWFRKLKDDIIPLLIMEMADIMSTCGPLSGKTKRDELIQRLKEMVCDYYKEIKIIIERKDLISGRDLIELGMKPGPAMGRVLNYIRDARDKGLIKTRSEALVLVKERGGNNFHK